MEHRDFVEHPELEGTRAALWLVFGAIGGVAMALGLLAGWLK